MGRISVDGFRSRPLLVKQSREDITDELGRFSMIVKKVSAGQMWKSEESGEIFMVTSLYREVLASYALLRTISERVLKQRRGLRW